MEMAFEVARSFGLGGLGLMATMLAVKLAIQAVDLARNQVGGAMAATGRRSPSRNSRSFARWRRDGTPWTTSTRS